MKASVYWVVNVRGDVLKEEDADCTRCRVSYGVVSAQILVIEG